MSECCPTTASAHDSCAKRRFDYFLWGSSFVIAAVVLAYLVMPGLPYIPVMARTCLLYTSDAADE